MELMLRRTFGAILAAVIGTSAAAPLVEAQYFGQNKVQYESFDFNVLKTEHFDIHYYEETNIAVEYAALMAERWYERLSRLLNHELSNRQKLILYASHPHFRQTNALGGVDESTQGATELFKRRMVLPFLSTLKETDHVIGHELVHAFQFDITGEGGGTFISGVPGAARMPLFFVEGMAEYLSVGHVDAETAMFMRALVDQDLPLEAIAGNLERSPYQYGQALWAYIAGTWGDDVVGRLLKAVRTTPSAGAAIQRVLRVSPGELISGWYDAMRAASLPLKSQTHSPELYGRAILSASTGSGYFNIAPALSPDASKVVYLSERDLFAIEMFMSDAYTGEPVRKLVKAAVDPHFEALQFVNSAGSWDQSGTMFTFSAVRRGHPSLTIINANTGKKIHEKTFKELGEIFNPAFSPDGQQVTFAALSGGVTDLYVYDMENEDLRRLTNDAHGDLQPVWSPDGEQIAFVTERFTGGMSSLMHGDYRIGLLNVRSGAIAEMEAFTEGKHINPQWAPDGESVYFISDQNGINNVYRKFLASGDITQVTNIFTGVAGISTLSPAMSVAAQTGEMSISVFQGGAIGIYRIDDPEVLAGGPVMTEFEDVDPRLLPPTERATNEVVALLNNPFFGLPADAQWPSSDYKMGFGLDYVSQPYLVVGASSFGTFIGGGAALFWSDVLGGHNLATSFQINGGVKDISAAVGYSNMNRRLNWGVTVEQFSFLNGGYSTALATDTTSGQTVFVDQFFRFRQISRGISLPFQYPLSRVQRIEFGVGVRNISYDYEVQETFVTQTGQVLDRKTTSIPSPDPLNLAFTNAALVYDNSFFGIASPILGQRYRFEAATTLGTLDFWQGLADYRKYLMPVRPFTLAARIMHIGRYGPDSEDNRLQPFYIGYPNLVRGYEIGSFNSLECGIGPGCPTVDQLYGSRMLVGNLELRFPPLGVIGAGDGFFGFLPLEMAFFIDGGLAWGSDDFLYLEPTEGLDERAFFVGGDREPVWSVGSSLRFNVFGYFIMGFDFVNPISRPGKGWHFQFNISPGF